MRLAFVLLAAASAVFPHAARGSIDSFDFAVVGHVRGGSHDRPNYLIPELVEELVALEPDLVFLTGDMIWGDLRPKAKEAGRERRASRVSEEWDRLDAAFEPLAAPIYRVPGNHDINDPVTRDIYFERYGRLPEVIEYGNSRFILLNSTWVPPGDGPPQSPRHVRGVDLDPGQIDFVRGQLDASSETEHLFVLLHHILWWNAGAAWWRDVHPVLAGSKVRAVFAGDYGPRKFSHLRRDNIDYLQSSIEGRVHLPLLRRRESSRVLHEQFENFLWVRVRGSEVRIEVKTLGALSSGKLTPEHWRQIHESATPPQPPPAAPPTPAAPGPARTQPRAWIWILGAIAFGFAAGLLWSRVRRGS